jgi:4-hydroxymandelate oxidase
VLQEVTGIDTATTLLGGRVAMPVMMAPMGRHRLYHPEGERASARGAAQAGAAYVLATTATVPVEDVAAEGGADAPQWFQLYFSGRDAAEAMLERAAAAGMRAIVLTVDQPVSGWSPRSANTPYEPSEAIRHVNMPGQPIARIAYDAAHDGRIMFPANLRDLEWLVRRSPLPVAVKGVLRADDARRCVDAGAKAVIVSNHGGRHLDGTVTSAEALPEIVDALGDSAEIYVDGGIRRGTDILKALALGARAVLVGRPLAWALAVHGADGVRDVLLHLRTELVRAMALCGVATVHDATPDLIAPARSRFR